MATNYPGPYQLVIHYTVALTPGGTVGHALQLNVDCPVEPDIGDTFDTIQIISIDDTTAYLDDVTDAMIVLLKELLPDTDATFDYAELFRVTALSFIRTWISTCTIGVAGVAVAYGIPAGQQTYQFRTAEGGIMKLVMLDTVGASALPINYGDLAVNPKALVDYMLADATNFFLGRDTSYPIAFISLCSGQNEKLFRVRYRP